MIVKWYYHITIRTVFLGNNIRYLYIPCLSLSLFFYIFDRECGREIERFYDRSCTTIVSVLLFTAPYNNIVSLHSKKYQVVWYYRIVLVPNRVCLNPWFQFSHPKSHTMA